MKKRKSFLAIILSWLMVFAAVSPAFAYSPNDVTSGKAIALNQPATSFLENKNAIRSFSFDIPGDGYFNVNVKPSANANLDKVKDGWKVEVYKADPFEEIFTGSANKNYTSLNYGTGAGKYYVVITSNSDTDVWSPINENFDVTISYQASSTWEKEDNGTTATANMIALNTVYSGNLYDYTDNDWYAFDLTSRGYINLSLKADVSENLDYIRDGWNIDLYNAAGQKIDYYESIKSFTSENKPLAAGRYYLQVSEDRYSGNYDGVDYNLAVDFTAADDWEIEPNDTSAQATAVSLNKTYHGLLYKSDDIDWYAFTLAQDSKIGFTFTQDASANLDGLGDGWDVKIKDATRDYLHLEEVKSAQYKEIELTAGTYYINVQRGGYYSPGTSIYDFNVGVVSAKTPAVHVTPVNPKPKKTSSKKTKKKAVKKQVKLGKTAIKKAKAGKKSIKVSWKKVKKAKSYQVSYKNAKSKKWVTKSTKKLSYNIKKLKSKKKYNIRVRAMSGKTAGAWSKVKTLKVK